MPFPVAGVLGAPVVETIAPAVTALGGGVYGAGGVIGAPVVETFGAPAVTASSATGGAEVAPAAGSASLAPSHNALDRACPRPRRLRRADMSSEELACRKNINALGLEPLAKSAKTLDDGRKVDRKKVIAFAPLGSTTALCMAVAALKVDADGNGANAVVPRKRVDAEPESFDVRR